MAERRFLIEAEQRQRIRAGALALEETLLAEVHTGDDGCPVCLGDNGCSEEVGSTDPDTYMQLVSVRSTLSRVGREVLYSETVEIQREVERVERKEARA